MIKEEWKDTHKRRDRLYIMAQILEITKDSSLKTQIMYKANLSFSQLSEYLSLLIEMNLLETVVNQDRTVYRTTRKGTEYLKSYKQIKDLLISEEGSTNTNLTSFNW